MLRTFVGSKKNPDGEKVKTEGEKVKREGEKIQVGENEKGAEGKQVSMLH